MKINKIIILLTVMSTLVIGAGCTQKIEDKEEPIETKTETNVEENKGVYYEIDKEYKANSESIMNNEKIKDLSKEDINKDYIINKAKEAESNVLEIENNADKVATIQRIVALDDLVHNTTKEDVVDVLNYIIEEYEVNKLRGGENTIQYFYLTTFLEKALNEYDGLAFTEDMIFDMNTICKDTIRQLDLSSIQSNVDQVNEVINDVKQNLNR